MKICIVGGGSAGWMTASTLVKAYPEWDVTLVESPTVPSVGVGESTTQFFRRWVNFLELEDEEWMPHCDATYKLSVRFNNFHEVGDTPWQYPFGIARQDVGGPDQWFYHASLNDWGADKFAEDYWLYAACATANKLPISAQIRQSTGFHFDAVKFANWLRDNYAVPRGVRHITGHVQQFADDKVYLDNRVINADLFFDCTGFKSLLNDSEWIDYSDYLPNNRAWTTRLQYKNIEEQMVPVTDCTALSSGWVWNVPTWSRIGTGYNFSNKYISEEDALQEFIDYLDVDDAEGRFRLVEYQTGRRKEVWNKNVVSIGLSAGFIEPLESNGLLSVHQFLENFIRVVDKREKFTQYMRDAFNDICCKGFDVFSGFVAAHYALTQRNDTDYWRAVSKIRYPDVGMLSWIKESYTASSTTFSTNFQFGLYEAGMCIMAGHKWNPFTDCIHSEIDFHGGVDPDSDIANFNVPEWEGIDNMPTPYDYYRKNLYEG